MSKDNESFKVYFKVNGTNGIIVGEKLYEKGQDVELDVGDKIYMPFVENEMEYYFGYELTTFLKKMTLNYIHKFL